MSEIIYQREQALDPYEFTDVLKRSTLSERRPVDEPERIRQMCELSNMIVTARLDGKLVGVARSLTDFAFCTYMSDLAVDEAYQRRGIGIRLIKETKLHTPQAKLILLAAPKAVDYYPKTGMTKFENSFILSDINDLKI